MQQQGLLRFQWTLINFFRSVFTCVEFNIVLVPDLILPAKFHKKRVFFNDNKSWECHEFYATGI